MKLFSAVLLCSATLAHAAPAKVDINDAQIVRLLECRPTSEDMRVEATDGLAALGEKHPLVRSKAAPQGAVKLPRPVTANGVTGDIIYASGWNIFLLVPSQNPADDIMKTAKRLSVSTENFSPEYPIYAFTKPMPSKAKDVNGRPLSGMKLAVYQGMEGPETDRYYMLGCEF